MCVRDSGTIQGRWNLGTKGAIDPDFGRNNRRKNISHKRPSTPYIFRPSYGPAIKWSCLAYECQPCRSLFAILNSDNDAVRWLYGAP